MPICVLPYDPAWPAQFEEIAAPLRAVLGLASIESSVEHVGSTSVPGLAAKPIIDIDVLVPADQIPDAIAALESIGYRHQGDLGVPGREAFEAPDNRPRRNVYVGTRDSLHIKNHLAVRDVLRRRPDLRDRYAAVKVELATNPDLDIDTYIARKSGVLQRVLADSALTTGEREAIRQLNDPGHLSS